MPRQRPTPQTRTGWGFVVLEAVMATPSEISGLSVMFERTLLAVATAEVPA